MADVIPLASPAERRSLIRRGLLEAPDHARDCGEIRFVRLPQEGGET